MHLISLRGFVFFIASVHFFFSNALILFVQLLSRVPVSIFEDFDDYSKSEVNLHITNYYEDLGISGYADHKKSPEINLTVTDRTNFSVFSEPELTDYEIGTRTRKEMLANILSLPYLRMFYYISGNVIFYSIDGKWRNLLKWSSLIHGCVQLARFVLRTYTNGFPYLLDGLDLRKQIRWLPFPDSIVGTVIYISVLNIYYKTLPLNPSISDTDINEAENYEEETIVSHNGGTMTTTTEVAPHSNSMILTKALDEDSYNCDFNISCLGLRAKAYFVAAVHMHFWLFSFYLDNNQQGFIFTFLRGLPEIIRTMPQYIFYLTVLLCDLIIFYSIDKAKRIWLKRATVLSLLLQLFYSFLHYEDPMYKLFSLVLPMDADDEHVDSGSFYFYFYPRIRGLGNTIFFVTLFYHLKQIRHLEKQREAKEQNVIV